MVFPYQTVTTSAQETQKLGEAFGHSVLRRKGRGAAQFVGLWGELGSGKTTFVQGVARGLGITSRLLSPTFIIVRRYDIPSSVFLLYHMDAYRLRAEQEVEALGFSEMLEDPNSIILVEWPERLGTLMPAHRYDIRFRLIEGEQHSIEIHRI